ncbi:MAG: protein kinase domain-containing protein [Nannocystaceae bacterium]|nr:serine/threonine-protein kinase [bacterium]
MSLSNAPRSGPTAADQTAPTGLPESLREQALEPGALLGRYHVLERIGAGGMGVVYAAFDPDLDRKVALKVLQPERLEGEAGSRGHARLIREAKAMAKLAHPNVVTVHDVGVFEERVFVAMEFVRGQTLSEWMKTSPPWQDVIECFTAAGRGLAAAHAEGMVHRDFKPDNVLIGHDGRPRVLDFGLARSAGVSSTEPQSEDLEDVSLELRMRSHDFDRITRTGGLTGTPAYMAPEQYLSKALDERTDQFSFCVALWEGLYGSRPFQGDSTAALGMAVCAGEVTPPPANSPVPARIRRALDRGLSQQPDERFPSMGALLEAIALERPRSKRTLWWSVGAVAAFGGLYAAFGAPTEDPCGAGDSRLAEVWSPARESQLRENFAEADAAYATGTINAVVGQLDAYGDEWSAAYRDACEATHVRREQSAHALDLRMSCLSRHLEALDSTASALENADATVIESAPRAVDQLPSISACGDVDTLDTFARPPDDPELATEVQALRERISGLTAQAHVVVRDPALPEAVAEVLDASKATEYGPLIAEAQFLASRFAVTNGDPKEAVEHLEETVYAALASDHDQVLASALTQLAQTTGILLSDYDEGMRWSRQAEAAINRLDPNGTHAANFHSVMCKFLADKGETQEAIPHCDRNVELYEALYGKDSISAAQAHESLGIALYYAHEYDKARAQWELARDLYAASEGEDHPDLARIANSLAAICYSAADEPAECVGAFEDAVRRASASYGDDHPMTADFRNNLAQILVDAGDVESGRAHARQALAARRTAGMTGHPGVAASLRILGRADVLDRNYDRAQRQLLEALEIAKKSRGEHHRDVLSVYSALTDLEIARRDASAARTYVDQAQSLAKALSADDEDLRERIAEVEALEAEGG